MAARRSKTHFEFLTLFPEMFSSVLGASLLGKASERGLVSYGLTQIRDFSTDKHRKVDDTPYGGGEGMLLKADVLHKAWKSVIPRKSRTTRTVLLSPQGELFDQQSAKRLLKYRKIVFVCGHYEGVDERFIGLCVDEELSIGDYILTGGEIPAMVVADAVARLVPGVVGNKRSLAHESLENGLLKYPQYTRPREFMGLGVPEVLLGGDHRAIECWRRNQSIERTRVKRPGLYKAFLEDKQGK
ncbi:MAG: tRNA (guanosine(37)-N1)-methyltransferase TrmD [Bdellovibrionales bacterium RIFOXYD1_FULL_53_11]|nr:MAG: tRNA (guanosine(37)-N1)-methyltransferase TrmD [Bdellovibrionales bacterium RIFOXYD1_FULL_53_11]